ncbi:acyl carrier protein phosphodiesterase [Flavobacteriaceae bacterium S356]|uniref:Acyl carrier protein phosphodiesterase n=2 Tax=Asprobacillus argus TaxID=3076534 RepID=A0ABU3LHX5_9FLAO|nr:acyl carrier protein phosphodiesterase [Flavobacteriaceae bacterium S356]
MIGNFVADSIRGNQFTHLHPEIQQGIRLHREIDTFTDAHDIVRRSKRRLHKRYGLYAGVVIDIFYDHYLAKNWNNYSAIPLDLYVDQVYKLLQNNFDILPEKTQYMLPFMIEHNWLYNYQFKEGIARVMNGMNRRTKNRAQMNLAIEDLVVLDKEFQEDFVAFFQELCIFSHQKLKDIQSA